MSERLYAESLKIFSGVQFDNGTERTATEDDQLFDWVLMRTLLDEPVAEAEEWWNSQRHAPSSPDESPIAEMLKWMHLAAVGELLGQDGRREARAAYALVGQAADAPVFETDQARFVQLGITLAMLSGDDAARSSWRTRRLSQPLYDPWEPTAFEVLYSSSEQAQEDKLDSLAMAATRAIMAAFVMRPFDSPAPHVLALATHARRANTTAPDLLRGKVHALDAEVFTADREQRIQIGPHVTKARAKGDDFLLRIIVPISGDGPLAPGAHAVSPLTTHLSGLIKKNVRRRKNAGEGTAAKTGKMVEGVLRLDEGVEVGVEQLRGFERRMQVGVEHARHLIDGLECEAALRTEPRPS